MGSPMIRRLIIAALIIWILTIIFLSSPFLMRGNPTEDQLIARINRAIDDLQALQEENKQLKLVVRAMNGGKAADVSSFAQPPKNYEVERRLAEDGVREIWYFANAQLKNIMKDARGDNSDLQKVKEGIYQRQLSVLAHLDKMKQNDGYETWRVKEAESLKQIVVNGLDALQNPADCSKAKKLICNLNKGCGYGCQIHHATYCLIMAVSLERTLILKSHKWRYNPNGFEDVFLPVSNSCTVETGGSRVKYPGDLEAMNIDLPIIDTIIPKPSSLPLAVPKVLAARLEQLHGNPALWWIAQILAYLQRPQPRTKEFLNAVVTQNAIKKPYIGLHIRRTDKINTEAAFHAVDEYMTWALEFFDLYELKHGPLDKRRIYVASDDAQVLDEARKKYPSYEFYGDAKISESASVKNRYSIESLRGVLADIHMLAGSEHLVCTMSSQVCRVAFELMQQRYPDASARFRSLDDIFYFGGQRDHDEIAIQDHSERMIEDEFTFVKGDVIGIAGNHWDGFSKGINRRTRQKGLYPSFKTREKIDGQPIGENLFKDL